MAAPRPLDGREPQTTAAVVMVRPAAFAANPETRASNAFQAAADGADLTAVARREFDGLVAALREHGVTVTVLDDAPQPAKPDAVFPNNWFSTHPDGTLVLYPMAAPNRRLERRAGFAAELRRAGSRVSRVIDLAAAEHAGAALEGTGSLVLDRANRVAYACRSARTDPAALADWAARLGYATVAFDAVDGEGRPCYHTNVVMSVGTGWAAVCFAAIPTAAERAVLRDRLSADGHELVELSLAQMTRFAGNLLELRGAGGRPLVVASATAWGALDAAQRAALERHATPVVAPIPTIERAGGGSVRCMIAENFLPSAPEATDA